MANFFLYIFEKILGKGGKDMIIMGYYTLIIAENITMENVPKRYKAAVEAKLLASGLDVNGNIII